MNRIMNVSSWLEWKLTGMKILHQPQDFFKAISALKKYSNSKQFMYNESILLF